MAREIEVKVLGLSEEELRPRIEAMGGFFEAEEHQTNYHIDSCERPFTGADYLRIRTSRIDGIDQPAELTYKRRLSSTLARENEEITVYISDVAEMLRLLDCLGYDRVRKGTKVRRRYVVEGARVEFDQWDAATLSYPYLEVEAVSQARLLEVLQALSIPEEAVTTRSIAELQALDRNRSV